MQRLQLQQEFERERFLWQQDNTLDEVVESDDIASVIGQWTGIPVNQMLESEGE